MKGTLAVVLTLVAFTSSAFAADPSVDGELHVTLKNAEYVKVQVNGENHDNIEFERDGKVVLIKGLSLTLEHNAIVLLPANPELQQSEIQVVPKDFKKQRKGREIFLVAKKTIAFEKASSAPAPTPDVPKTDPVAPPPPEKDNL